MSLKTYTELLPRNPISGFNVYTPENTSTFTNSSNLDMYGFDFGKVSEEPFSSAFYRSPRNEHTPDNKYNNIFTVQ